MKHLFIFSIILYSFTSQSVNSQNVDYDNWSSACDDAITTVDLNQCFYRQRHIADSLMLDTYNKISVIIDKGLEEAALESDKEMIQWYGDFKTSLSEGQGYWGKMSQADANFTGNLSKGGSMSTMTIHISATEASYKRLKVLSGFLEYLSL